MTEPEVAIYRKDVNFMRNQAVYTLSTIDRFNNKELAEEFDLPEKEICTILERHKDFWLSTYYV